MAARTRGVCVSSSSPPMYTPGSTYSAAEVGLADALEPEPEPAALKAPGVAGRGMTPYGGGG
eukprot:4569740-Alexandrium_andersonii.AAC.1